MEEMSTKYDDPGSLDKLTAVQAKTDAVKKIMQDNVDAILANSEGENNFYNIITLCA
jgi:hypothetical protein